jgi:hypothetical protein
LLPIYFDLSLKGSIHKGTFYSLDGKGQLSVFKDTLAFLVPFDAPLMAHWLKALCGTRVWCNGLISDEIPKRKSFERGKWFDGAFDAHPPPTTTVATPTPNTRTARPAPPSLQL